MRIFIAAFFSCIVVGSVAQSTRPNPDVARPKLVVGIVVDQMRWDYLYRYYSRYTAGGFKRLLNEGFSCENTFIPYAPTVTAAGHSCIYTGSVPAINGITGNAWWDRLQQRSVYCTDDAAVMPVGSSSIVNGKMSPKNLLVTTIADELRLATNFRSKVIGVALKDRGSILPAGHSANAAYWYDGSSGNFITSTYYMNELPAWAKSFNEKKLVDKYYAGGWKTIYPSNTYIQSSEDEKAYEVKAFGREQLKFPYELKQFVGKDYWKIASTPWGNTLTLDMAKAVLENEKLGQGNETDMLCVSFSSPDYVGHAFGPNSIEVEDTYLRLDKELENFFSYLDERIGKGQYTVFLSADHGVANVPGFLKEHKLPGGLFDVTGVMRELNAMLKTQTGVDSIVANMYNYQVHLNNRRVADNKLSEDELKDRIIQYLNKMESVSFAFDIKKLNEVPLNAKVREMLNNGYYLNRNGDIQFILKSGFIEAGSTGTTHGLWNPYDAHIPLLWYGWGIKKGKTNRETYMTDIAPTLAALLHIQMPGGCVGKVVEEVIR
jgi:predicted AlkP superfamily pyrophosphatase or phosphodiesterase